MKTAISLPDETFARADRFARKTSRSRSKLFADAIEEYLDRHAPDEVTQAMNEALVHIEGEIDPLVRAAGLRTLRRSEW